MVHEAAVSTATQVDMMNIRRLQVACREAGISEKVLAEFDHMDEYSKAHALAWKLLFYAGQDNPDRFLDDRGLNA